MLRAGRGLGCLDPERRLRCSVCTSLVFLLTFFLLLAAACRKETPTTSERRAATHDLVAAAQKIVGRNSEIAIRPEIEPGRGRDQQRLPMDHIYVTAGSAKQETALERALDQAARAHGLALLSRVATTGVVRVDYGSKGRRTHSAHIVTRVAQSLPGRALAARGPRLAIIVDDLGYDRESAEALLNLPFPLTVSVLPHLPFSTEIAEEAHRRGDQVMLHLPMAPANGGVKAEAVELRIGMQPVEVEATLAAMLETVPYAAGVNNHQGSQASSDRALMTAVMAALRRRGLFFIDSRTTTATVAYDEAQRSGVPAAYRNVFLDDTSAREAVLRQLDLAARDAERQGWAIAIGHPHPGTLAALEEALPRLEERGIRLVFASELAR